jgi:K+-sensing histidine kinase KdpD
MWVDRRCCRDLYAGKVPHRRSSFGFGPATPSSWLGVLATVVAVGLATLLLYPLKTIAPAVSLGVVYIPGVLFISSFWGWRIGFLAAIASALAFNWFHIPPTGRFDIAADRDAVALVTFVIVAAAGSALAEMARARAAEAERRRGETERLLGELRELAAERDRIEAEAIEAEALRRSDELKTALLRSVSHDLRTPLTSIIATGTALDSPSLSEEERHELSEAVVQEGQRLSRLVENLLDVSRLESGNAEPRRVPIDLAGVLETARESISDAGRVRLGLDPEIPPLVADPVQLERAFANLFENAVRHGGGRPVLVRSRESGGRLVVRVVDQGPGIPEQERGRIFEPFYRRGGSGSGFGLGLAIARGFIEANCGEVAVESVPGQGSTFVVSFPLNGGGT